MATAPHIVGQAAEWVGTLDSDEATEADRRACEAWCALDERNRATFEAMRAMHRRLDGAPAYERSALRALTGASRNRHRRFASAAIVLVGLTAATWMTGTSNMVRDRFPDHATARGEQRSVALTGGNAVTLDTYTEIRVLDTGSGETVRLVDGRLFAQVRKTPGRRFVVQTPFGTAMARGTAFAVERGTDAMVVTVTESIVEVCPAPGARRSACVDAHPGDQVTVTGDGVLPTGRVDAAAITRWRLGWIEAVDKDFGVVIGELNRYLDRPAVLASPDLARIKISGSFPLGKPQTALAGAAHAAGLRLRPTASGTVLVER